MRCVRSVGQGQTSIEPSVSSAALMSGVRPAMVWFVFGSQRRATRPPSLPLPVYPLCIAAAGLSYRERSGGGGGGEKKWMRDKNSSASLETSMPLSVGCSRIFVAVSLGRLGIANDASSPKPFHNASWYQPAGPAEPFFCSVGKARRQIHRLVDTEKGKST